MSSLQTDPVREILRSGMSAGAKLAAIAVIVCNARTTRELADCCNVNVRSMERHAAEMRGRKNAGTTQTCGSDSANVRTPGTQNCATDPRVRGREESPSGIDSSQASKPNTEAHPALSGLNGSAQPMLEDICAWMGGGDAQAARCWLANSIKLFGVGNVKNAYARLKTKLAEGALYAKPLSVWTKILQDDQHRTASKIRVSTCPPEPIELPDLEWMRKHRITRHAP